MNIDTDKLIEDKNLRDTMMERTDILDKVKNLFLIPSIDMMTARQISEFYEVDANTVKLCYQRNRAEIDSDGTIVKKSQDFAKMSNGTFCTFRKESSINVFEYEADGNKIQVVVSNRGVRCFSKRAILRFGMLLRDSSVAQEVRTQLLNIVEHTAEESPSLITADIDEEKNLMMAVGMAFANGDVMEMLKATTEYNAFKDRHIKAVESENARLVKDNEILTDKNDTLSKDNDILSGNILEWSNSASANKVVRCMANTLGWKFGDAWNNVYDELLYRHSINLKMRKAYSGKKTASQLSFIKDDEWELLFETIAAMLQARYVNPSKIFAKAKKII